MARIDLPSGGWADVRDPNAILLRDWEAYEDVVNGYEPGLDDSRKLRNARLAMIVTAWSFADIPVPSEQPEALRSIPALDMKRIHTWWVENVEPVFYPDEDADEDLMDPKAGPAASNGSSTPSPDGHTEKTSSTPTASSSEPGTGINGMSPMVVSATV